LRARRRPVENVETEALCDACAWFVAAFREATEKLCLRDRDAPFPGGSFPPALPFV